MQSVAHCKSSPLQLIDGKKHSGINERLYATTVTDTNLYSNIQQRIFHGARNLGHYCVFLHRFSMRKCSIFQAANTDHRAIEADRKIDCLLQNVAAAGISIIEILKKKQNGYYPCSIPMNIHQNERFIF